MEKVSAASTTTEDEHISRLRRHLLAHHLGDLSARVAVTIFREANAEQEFVQS
jgi:hypothetical protein